MTSTTTSTTSALEDFVAEETGLQRNIATAFKYVADEIIDNITEHADMVIRGLNSAMVILSGRGLLIRNRERNDFTELPEPVYMPGTLVCFTMPVQKDGFTIYEYIGG